MKARPKTRCDRAIHNSRNVWQRTVKRKAIVESDIQRLVETVHVD